VAVEGRLINWTPCFRVPLTPRAELDYVMSLAEKKCKEEPQLYQPPRLHKGVLQSGFLVSRVSDEVDRDPPCDNSFSEEVNVEESAEQVMLDLARIEIEKEDSEARSNRSSSTVEEAYGDHGSVEEGIREDKAYESEEVGGVSSGGCAGTELVFSGIGSNMPRKALAEATAKDNSLQLVKQWATEERQGYRYENGIVLRDRLDDKGESVHQVCVPEVYRKKCLNLVHTKFGHQGRNKMIALLKPYFYWPKMAKDCVGHIKGCVVCQTFDKGNPPRSRMQMREIASTPFERVAVDLVGPFPTATGGQRAPVHQQTI